MGAPNWYYDEQAVAAQVALGKHRDAIGGLWEEMGDLQAAFLLAQGLANGQTILDLGCGSGRLAVKLAPLLPAGRYYGIDISPALLNAARAELDAAGFRQWHGRSTFHATPDFTPSFDMPPFDFIIAQSLFTHLPLSDLSAALRAVRAHTTPATRMFATFFVTPDRGLRELRHDIGGVTTFSFQDPYHYEIGDIENFARLAGWQARWIGDWRHPRDQQMCEFNPL